MGMFMEKPMVIPVVMETMVYSPLRKSKRRVVTKELRSVACCIKVIGNGSSLFVSSSAFSFLALLLLTKFPFNKVSFFPMCTCAYCVSKTVKKCP